MWHVWDGRGAYRVLVGKSEEKDHLRYRHRWEDNIRMGLRKRMGGRGLI
jgi:hypothetical protein